MKRNKYFKKSAKKSWISIVNNQELKGGRKLWGREGKMT
jgi:hypothetical protein